MFSKTIFFLNEYVHQKVLDKLVHIVHFSWLFETTTKVIKFMCLCLSVNQKHTWNTKLFFSKTLIHV